MHPTSISSLFTWSVSVMFKHLQKLYDQQLWSNLCRLGELALSNAVKDRWDAKTSTEPRDSLFGDALAPKQLYCVQAMLAEAYMECKEFRRAETLFKDALLTKKELAKGKGPSSSKAIDDGEKMFSEVTLKFKLHLCYVEMGSSSLAIEILQTVPAKQRTPKLNMAMGKLYVRNGLDRPAVSCFREVLKVCPMAMEATKQLLQLGVKPKEIQELTLEATVSTEGHKMDWFHSWVSAHAAFASGNYFSAITIIKKLEKGPLRQDVNLLVTLGKALYYIGRSSAARATLLRVHRIDPTNLHGMDVLAAIMYKDQREKELDQLTIDLMGMSEEATEPWIVFGYQCFLKKKFQKAVYFAHKACMLNQRDVEALLLKGNVLFELKKLNEAIDHFREAMVVAPWRYEVHHGLIDCYLEQARHKEAVSLAATACVELKNSARAFTLFAKVLVKDPNQTSPTRAKNMLEKALSQDPSHLPAVYMMASLLEQESKVDKAIELLEKQIERHSTSKLHLVLAELFAKSYDDDTAHDHYMMGEFEFVADNFTDD